VIAVAPAPRGFDGFRITWWFGHSFRLVAAKSQGFAKVYAAAFYVLSVALCIVLAMPAAWYLLWVLRRHSTRFYMTPEHDAVLAVVATRNGWVLKDHASARPGSGRGRALRDVVLPELVRAADAGRIAVRLTAAHEDLARVYASEVPGLVDTGPAFPRGRKMRREPQTADV
jgi:hypothetical protein